MWFLCIYIVTNGFLWDPFTSWPQITLHRYLYYHYFLIFAIGYDMFGSRPTGRSSKSSTHFNENFTCNSPNLGSCVNGFLILTELSPKCSVCFESCPLWGLNCGPSKFICWNLKLNVAAFRDKSFKEVLKLNDIILGPKSSKTVLLQRGRFQGFRFLSLHVPTEERWCEDTARGRHQQARKRSLIRNQLWWHLDFVFLVLTTMKT